MRKRKLQIKCLRSLFRCATKVNYYYHCSVYSIPNIYPKINQHTQSASKKWIKLINIKDVAWERISGDRKTINNNNSNRPNMVGSLHHFHIKLIVVFILFHGCGRALFFLLSSSLLSAHLPHLPHHTWFFSICCTFRLFIQFELPNVCDMCLCL